MSKRTSYTGVRSSTTSSGENFEKYPTFTKKASKYSGTDEKHIMRKISIASTNEPIDRPRKVRSKRSIIVKCPLCLDDFTSSEIEQHASLCLELNELITKPKYSGMGNTVAKADKPYRSMIIHEKSISKNINKDKQSISNSSMNVNENPPTDSYTSRKSNHINTTKMSKCTKRKHSEEDYMHVKRDKKEISLKKKSVTRSLCGKKFKIEKIPGIKELIFTRALNSYEQSIVHALDLKVQKKFPSYVRLKSMKNQVICPVPASEKPFASLNDARRFLFLLQDFVMLRIKLTNNISSRNSNPTSTFVLSYIKMVKDVGEEKVTLPKFVNSFLLLFLKELLTEVENRKSKAVEILRMFNTFLPCSHNLAKKYPDISELFNMSDAACSTFDKVFTEPKLFHFCKKVQLAH